jgi:antitoxin (DNA-binding transcriptional repressor) of toxin-antitoxin stability system
MKTLTITESKANLSALVKKVFTSGKAIAVGRAGKPMVQLVKFTPAQGTNRIGAFAGKITVAPDFKTWEGEEVTAIGLDEK